MCQPTLEFPGCSLLCLDVLPLAPSPWDALEFLCWSRGSSVPCYFHKNSWNVWETKAIPALSIFLPSEQPNLGAGIRLWAPSGCSELTVWDETFHGLPSLQGPSREPELPLSWIIPQFSKALL